jgi:hypothetical protein
MNMIQKFYLSLAFCLGILSNALAAPVNVRMAVKPGLIKSTAGLLKQPNFVLAGLGVASLAYAKYCAIRAEDPLPQDINQKEKYEKRGELAFMIGAGLLGMSANFLLLSQLKKRGYLPKLTNRSAGVAALGFALGTHGLEKGSFLMHSENLNEWGKKCKPYCGWFILGGLQMCITAGMYLKMA